MRLTRRVVAPERLGFVDVVLSTHGHTDHLDEETLRAIEAPVVAPAGTVQIARERSGREVTGVSEGEMIEVAGFRIEAVPARASGRPLRRVRDRSRPVPALPLRRHDVRSTRACAGSTSPSSRSTASWGTSTAPEGARLAHTVEAALAVPCHYDMFEFNTADPDAFTAECDRLDQPYRVLRNGERLSVVTPTRRPARP